jgi:TRAP-type C4-dicarboxylate transport system substrate-binding protein
LFGYGLKDVVKTLVNDVPLGVFPAVGIMTINNNSWNKLSSNQKNILVKHMPATIGRVVNGYYEDESRGVREGKERGVKFVQFGAAYQKAWKDFQAKEPAAVLEAAKKRGVQSAEAIVKANSDNLKTWQDMVDKSGGMTVDKYVAMLNQRVYSKIKF